MWEVSKRWRHLDGKGVVSSGDLTNGVDIVSCEGVGILEWRNRWENADHEPADAYGCR